MESIKKLSSDHLIDKPPPAQNKPRLPIHQRLRSAVATACAVALLLLNSAHAQVVPNKSTVIFGDDVSDLEIDLFLASWDQLGVVELMRVPLVNGVVVSLPSGLSDADLLVDPIIDRVDASQNLDVLTMQAAGEGGATRFIEPFPEPPSEDRPWGVLELLDQPYDPTLYHDYLDRRNLPRPIEEALKLLARHQVRVAIFDTGIDASNKKFNIGDGIDLVNMLPGVPLDDNGHGTHIAGTLVANKFGLATGSKLYAVKILDHNAAGDSTTLVMALQWALDNDIDVVNMSVGFRADNPLVRQAVEAAYDAGLIMVTAVGNYSNWHDDGGAGEGGAGEGGAGEGGAGEGGAGSTCDNSSGTGEGGAGEGGAGTGACPDSELYSVMYPAKYPQTIAVGAMDSNYQIAWFSNTGPEVDVLAPGVDVVSFDINGAFGVASGTSMAAPHVAATVALMQVVVKDCGKTLSPAQAKDFLTASMTEFGRIHLPDILGELNGYCRQRD